MRIEDKIRKSLAKNLKLLSDEFELIEEEYYLENFNGTTGRIDILAKDLENNYVIIEIKRSNQAARQALHEIAKYRALLKHKFFVKDSEIRAIIVSTEWDELLVPFSEAVKDSMQYLEGFKLEVDDSNTPISSYLVEPLNIDKQREFSRCQSLFLYSKGKNLTSAKDRLVTLVKNISLKDFIILEIQANKDIMFPCGLCFAFQKHSETYYLSVLKALKTNSDDDTYGEAIEIKNDPEFSQEYYLNFIEENFMIDIINKMNCDSYEISYPEKISHALSDLWSVKKINKYGIFQKDVRLTDRFIITELCGYNGGSFKFYFNQCLSKHKSKLVDIIKDVNHSLYHNYVWKSHIEIVLNNIIAVNNNCRISVMVSNPQNIIGSISSCGHKDFLNSFPQYQIWVDNIDINETSVYYGVITYIGNCTSYNKIVEKYFYNDEFNYFLLVQLGEIYNVDMDISADLGLKYESELLIIRGEIAERQSLDFSNGTIKVNETKNQRYIDSWVSDNTNFTASAIDLFEKYYYESRIQ